MAYVLLRADRAGTQGVRWPVLGGVVAALLPDVAALKAAPARVVVGIGADSAGLDTYQTSTALANRQG